MLFINYIYIIISVISINCHMPSNFTAVLSFIIISGYIMYLIRQKYISLSFIIFILKNFSIKKSFVALLFELDATYNRLYHSRS